MLTCIDYILFKSSRMRFVWRVACLPSFSYQSCCFGCKQTDVKKAAHVLVRCVDFLKNLDYKENFRTCVLALRKNENKILIIF